MPRFTQLRRSLAVLFHRDRFARDLEEEIESHLEMQSAENRANGMPADQALYAARRQFGNRMMLRETSRETWGWNSVERLLLDVRYAARILKRSPGFTSVAVLSLALGIGVNTAIFSIVDNLLLRPLPVPQSDRLVSLQHLTPKSGVYDMMSYPDYLYYRDHNAVFSGMVAHDAVTVTLGDGDSRSKVPGEIVSANYFGVLGIRPVIGRWFAPDEEAPVVVLGHGLWQRRFGGDAAVVGRTITVNRYKFLVIGVAPRGFAGLPAGSGPARAELWATVASYREILPELADIDLPRASGCQWLSATGRLKPGIGIREAEASLRVASAGLAEPWRRIYGDLALTPLLVPASENRIASAARPQVLTYMWMLAGTVALVLFVACVNVAGLMLARALKREREIAVRLSLGASHGRILRQLLVESLILSGTGGTLGILLAWPAARFLASFGAPFRIPMAFDSGIDPRVLVFAAALSVLCAILCGMLPARQAVGCDLATAMKGDSSGLVSGARRSSLRGLMLAAQVALSVVLLAGASLFVRTLIHARAADVTVDPGHVLLTGLNARERGYDQSRAQAFYERLLERLNAAPGVKSAALVLVVPLGGRRGGTNIRAGEREIQVDFNAVSARYFETVGIPLLRGRAFTRNDRAGSAPVVVVNEQFAAHFFPGQDPIGKSIELTYPRRTRAEVVGLVRDGRFRSVRAPVKPCFYQPIGQFPSGIMSLEVRTAGDPAAFAATLRREIQTLDPDFPIDDIATLRSHREAGLAQERLMTALLTGFAALALVLAAIGIYGVVSFAVAQRTREIGLRMALGADRGTVLRLVLGRGAALVLAGIAAGLAAALVLTRFVSGLLYGVTATDPWTYGGVSLLLTAVALLAGYLPARRATRIDPMGALRYE